MQLLYYIIVDLQLFSWFSKCICDSSQMFRLFMAFYSLELLSQATSSTSTSSKATLSSVFCTSTLPQFCYDVKWLTRSFLELYRLAFVKSDGEVLANLIAQNPSKVHSAEAYSAIQEYDLRQHFRWGPLWKSFESSHPTIKYESILKMWNEGCQIVSHSQAVLPVGLHPRQTGTGELWVRFIIWEKTHMKKKLWLAHFYVQVWTPLINPLVQEFVWFDLWASNR